MAPVTNTLSFLSVFMQSASPPPPPSQALSGLNGFESGATAELIALLKSEPSDLEAEEQHD